MKELETTVIIFLFATLFTLSWCSKSEARNDYLNYTGERCSYGSVELTINQYVPEQQQLQTFDGNYNNGNRSLNLRFRKELGVAKKTCDEQNRIKTQNMKLMQQLELNKNCPRINRDTTLQYNNNFNELVAYCKNIKGEVSQEDHSQSSWDIMKDDYKKENPEIKLMGDKLIKPKDNKLKIPKYLTDEDIILPLPKP